jgi:hypothetical protein
LDKGPRYFSQLLERAIPAYAFDLGLDEKGQIRFRRYMERAFNLGFRAAQRD